MRTITVAGTGYVGLVTGICLAEIGNRVICVDINVDKIEMLKRGVSTIFEPGLEELLKKNLGNGRLEFSSDCNKAYASSDVVFIGVGTPERKDGSANLEHLAKVTRQIAESITKNCIIVVKSTVPVGTNDKIERLVIDTLQRRCITDQIKVEIASNPEFLAQGSAVYDTLHASRIIIGTTSEWAKSVLTEVYSQLNTPIVFMGRKSAEMTKYASNSFLAFKISYINDIANLCELVGADILEVTKGMSYDDRIGNKFLNAGVGYGGSCFPKDTKALSYLAKENGYSLKSVQAAIDINHDQIIKLINKASKRVISFSGLKVAVLGLTFKPGTDDVREAPSLINVAKLLEKEADVVCYDPIGVDNFKSALRNCSTLELEPSYVYNVEEALNEADLCFIFTEWQTIRSIKPGTFKSLMKTPIIFDGRNIFKVEDMRSAGVEYYSIGRSDSK